MHFVTSFSSLLERISTEIKKSGEISPLVVIPMKSYTPFDESPTKVSTKYSRSTFFGLRRFSLQIWTKVQRKRLVTKHEIR